MKVLKIDSSPRSERSFSRRLTTHFTRSLGDVEIIERDLAQSQIPYVTEDWVVGVWGPEEAQTDASRKAMAIAGPLVEEFLQADHIIIGAPMYNFGSPAVLKAYFDQIIQMGKLVKMEEGQFVGLATTKSATVVVTRGGAYSPGSGAEAYDHQEGHLRVILGFIGITEVKFIYCENLASDEASQNDAFEKAKVDIAAVATSLS